MAGSVKHNIVGWAYGRMGEVANTEIPTIFLESTLESYLTPKEKFARKNAYFVTA